MSIVPGRPLPCCGPSSHPPSCPAPSRREYGPLEETLEILQDKDLMDAPRKSEDDVGAGRLTSLDDLRRSSFVGCVFGRGSAFGPRPQSPARDLAG